MPEDRSKVLQSWGESGHYWEKYGPTIRSMFEPVAVALMRAVGASANSRVLDVAAGIGEPSLTIARQLPSATVWCTDPAASMIEAAKKEASRAKLSKVQFAQCLADALPFDDEYFDGVVSRFGIMFFPDPEAGVREMLRALKEGGRVAAAVWCAPEANPFHFVISDALAKYIPPVPAGPDDPTAFRFAPPRKLAAIFERAGARDVSENVLRFTIEAQKTPEEFWQMRAEMSDANREKLARLTAGQRQNLQRDVLEVLPQFSSGGMMRFPAEVLIVRGTR